MASPSPGQLICETASQGCSEIPTKPGGTEGSGLGDWLCPTSVPNINVKALIPLGLSLHTWRP